MKRIRKMAGALLTVCVGTLLVPSLHATELAILRNGFSIRHDHHAVIGDTTRLYLAPDDSNFTDVPSADIVSYEKDLSTPAPLEKSISLKPVINTPQSRLGKSAALAPAIPLNDVVNSASATYHLDPDLVNSVIHAESGFNAHAVSPKGARGLMQLMPGTASQLGVNDAFDPQSNVTGGSRYLRELLERYNFDLVKALAAYNAGPERVEQYRGVPPFRETRAYVARIVHEYNTKKIAQEKAARQQQKSQSTIAKAPSKRRNASSKLAATAVAAPAAR